MIKIFWTNRAKKDLGSIYDFIAIDSAYYANLVINAIIITVGKLKDFPGMGRIVPELDDASIREVFYKNYRIVYRIKGSTL
jgi:plasmid stabilization system protein ParE